MNYTQKELDGIKGHVEKTLKADYGNAAVASLAIEADKDNQSVLAITTGSALGDVTAKVRFSNEVLERAKSDLKTLSLVVDKLKAQSVRAVTAKAFE
ncbi:MAG: hypothetical protein Q8Q08_12860 [Candidatus Omnitrophota bacterium]|nr:hypothetical protein [Candidatus Omnitrophota bacterium]